MSKTILEIVENDSGNFSDYFVKKNGEYLDFYIANLDCEPECCSYRNWIIICNKCNEDITPHQLLELPVEVEAMKWEIEKVKITASQHQCCD